MKLEEKLVLQAFWEKIKKYFATKLYVATLKSSKQDTLIAGKGIRIVNNVISNSLFPYKYKNDQGEWVVQGTDEKVIVTLFGPPGFNLANRQIILTYYQANEPVLPARVITKTTDSNGVVIFRTEGEEKTGVPVGYEYEITFPKIDTYQEITPEKHVAGVVERNIEVTYIGLPDISEDDYGEEITIHLDKFENNEVTPFPSNIGGTDTKVSIKIGTATATTYDIDANGNVILKKDNNGNDIPLKIRYGQTYTVTVPTTTNYYIPAAKYTQTYTSEKRHRDISFMYRFIRAGVFIVDKNGKEYTGEEWEYFRDDENVDEQDRVVNEDAILLKIASSTLAAYNGIFGVDIDNLRLRNYGGNVAWANLNVQFNSIPSTQSQNSSVLYYYDGYVQSSLIQKEGDDRLISTPAVDRCLSKTKNISSIGICQGFLGSPGQWQTIWNNRNTIDALLEIVRPTTEKPDGVTYYQFNNLTTGKWTSGQSNYRCGCYFNNKIVTSDGIGNYKSSTTNATIPFFTC